MSEEHLLAYYRWGNRTHWKLDSIERGEGGEPVLAYVNYNDKLWDARAKEGSVVWVVGLGPDGSPTLEARIVVADTFRQLDPDPPHGKRRWGTRVEGCGRSRFFGLNHAAPGIMKLVFASQSGNWSLRERRGSPRWTALHGRHLRSSRLVAPGKKKTSSGYASPGARPLKQLAKLASEKSIFLSWKHMDNDENRRRFLRELATCLAKRGFVVWMDQLALGDAQEIAERPDNRRLMTGLLRQGLKGCRAVIGVWTEHYGAPSSRCGENWTMREWEDLEDAKRLALHSGRFQPKTDMRTPDGKATMPVVPAHGDVRRVAAQVKAKLDSLLASGS